MYKCNDCKSTFENCHTVIDDNSEKWYVCPNCRSTDFDEAKRCEECGDFFVDSRENETCEECLKELQYRFSDLLHQNFTERQIRALNIIYEGKDLK